MEYIKWQSLGRSKVVVFLDQTRSHLLRNLPLKIHLHAILTKLTSGGLPSISHSTIAFVFFGLFSAGTATEIVKAILNASD